LLVAAAGPPLLRPRSDTAVASDKTSRPTHTVSWEATCWGVPREEVCAGLRGAQVELERGLDGSHWLRFRGRYLRLHHCPEPLPRRKINNLYRHTSRPRIIPGGHFYFALTVRIPLTIIVAPTSPRCDRDRRLSGSGAASRDVSAAMIHL